MRLQISDKKWGCIDATCLLGIAAFIVFVIKPGGFEGQAVWFYFLFPGAIPAALLSDIIYKHVPSVAPVIYWALVIGLSFAWYWGLSYAFIKTFHDHGWRLGSPEF